MVIKLKYCVEIFGKELHLQNQFVFALNYEDKTIKQTALEAKIIK